MGAGRFGLRDGFPRLLRLGLLLGGKGENEVADVAAGLALGVAGGEVGVLVDLADGNVDDAFFEVFDGRVSVAQMECLAQPIHRHLPLADPHPLRQQLVQPGIA